MVNLSTPVLKTPLSVLEYPILNNYLKYVANGEFLIKNSLLPGKNSQLKM
jgi:hypothetical protein